MTIAVAIVIRHSGFVIFLNAGFRPFFACLAALENP